MKWVWELLLRRSINRVLEIEKRGETLREVSMRLASGRRDLRWGYRTRSFWKKFPISFNRGNEKVSRSQTKSSIIESFSSLYLRAIVKPSIISDFEQRNLWCLLQNGSGFRGVMPTERGSRVGKSILEYPLKLLRLSCWGVRSSSVLAVGFTLKWFNPHFFLTWTSVFTEIHKKIQKDHM